MRHPSTQTLSCQVGLVATEHLLGDASVAYNDIEIDPNQCLHATGKLVTRHTTTECSLCD